MLVATGSLTPVQTNIAGSSTTSPAIPTSGSQLVGVFLPAAFTGTTLTFIASPDGVIAYSKMKKSDGSDLSYTVAQGTFVIIDPADFAGIQFFKIVSGSTETSQRILNIVLKGM